MIALLMILIAAVYTDYRQNRIPNWIIVFGLISGCFISYMYGGIGMLLEGLLGMVLPIVLLYPVFVIGGMGAGDLKLFAVVGSYLGIKGITISFVSAFIVGATISLMKMMCFHNFKERIYYFFSYLSDLFLEGKWQLYETSKGQASEESLEFPKHKIHFALPIFLGVAIYLGGIL